MARRKKTSVKVTRPKRSLRAWWQSNKMLLWRGAMAAAWLMTIGGLVLAWILYVPKLQAYASARRGNIDADHLEIRFLNQPPWVRGDLEAQLIQTAKVNLSVDPLDQPHLAAAHRALEATGWFDEIRQVRRVHAGLIVVDSDFVSPRAFIRDADGDHLVDKEGRLLPLTFAVSRDRPLIAIVGARFPRPAKSGQQWEGADVAAALKLLQVVRKEAWWTQISAVDVSNHRKDQTLTLISNRGCAIIWGRAPGEEPGWENPTSRKIECLTYFNKVSGHIDRGYPSVDLRKLFVTIEPAQG